MSSPNRRPNQRDEPKIPPLSDDFKKAMEEVDRAIKRMQIELEDLKKQFEETIIKMRRALETQGAPQGG